MGRIGIIGGSGLYKIEALKGVKKVSLTTPFGKPSDKFVTGKLEGKEVVFLPRHGVGHRISPSEINYRANIYGMKKLGVERILSVTACGSLKEEIKPLDFVVVDQFVDRTNQARSMTFFEKGAAVYQEPRLRWAVKMRKLRCTSEARILIWRVRHFPRWPNPIFIASGAWI